MRIINENTDILLSEGYSEYCIHADRDIEISFRGYTTSEVYIRIEKAKKIKIRSFSGKDSNIKFLLWNDTKTLLDIDETYDVMQNASTVVAYGECNEADTKRNTYMALRGVNANGKLSSALLVKNHKEINMQLVNFAEHTTGNIENYGVVLKGGKLIIDAIGKIVKGASHSESHQSSRAMSFAEGQSTTILPELLIDENDVQASHAMSIGRVDENQLYYLMSRGLSLEACTALISTGYLMPITRVLGDKELCDKLSEEMERKISELC
jgi:Fe-S cluster assembly protein SufD